MSVTVSGKRAAGQSERPAQGEDGSSVSEGTGGGTAQSPCCSAQS